VSRREEVMATSTGIWSKCGHGALPPGCALPCLFLLLRPELCHHGTKRPNPTPMLAEGHQPASFLHPLDVDGHAFGGKSLCSRAIGLDGGLVALLVQPLHVRFPCRC